MGEKRLIPIDIISKDFDEHLNIENNNNLLFSGKFGLGKTYFIKEFFKEKEGEYEVFHLFPVNYQISSNEDIIDLLKYDILVELIKKNKDIFKDNKIEDFTDLSNMIYLFGNENKTEILKTALGFIPKLGKPLKETVVLFEKFMEFKGEIEKGEKGIIDDFLENTKNITETDILSELINNKIKEIKSSKKSILILDDLDRIDPEHIFRILNIFGAHFCEDRNIFSNKFGFDKIMLVGDYDNLKSIFHHKFGENTDFRGYINKFFSSEIYFFDNSKIVNSVVQDIIQEFKIGDDNFKGALRKDSGYIEFILKIVLGHSILLKTDNKITIRELLNGTKYNFSNLNKVKGLDEIYYLETGINLLISIYGGRKDNLLDSLNDIKNDYNFHESTKNNTLFYDICYVLINDLYLYKEIINIKGKYNLGILDSDGLNISIKYNASYGELIILFYEVLIDYIEQKL